MAHIGALFPGVPGHLNPVSCLGRELQARGHRVTTFQPLDWEEPVLRSGLGYQPIGRSVFPLGAVKAHYARQGTLQGLAALRHTISYYVEKSRMILDEAPEAIRQAGIDLLLVDQTEVSGACVAERLDLPFVAVSNALLLIQEPDVPPFFTNWAYSARSIARLRNRLAYGIENRLTKPLLALVNQQRQLWQLPLYSHLEDSTSPWAHLSQQPAGFDFPRQRLPAQFHYTGPWQDRRVRPPVPFPYEKLTGQPLIYASMGTLQNRIQSVFQEIARACEGLDAQLVVSLGGGSTPEQIGTLPGNPLVVGYAPQLELLCRAALTITHAGLNTTLESLSYGVPMVAIPVGTSLARHSFHLPETSSSMSGPAHPSRSWRARHLFRIG